MAGFDKIDLNTPFKKAQRKIYDVAKIGTKRRFLLPKSLPIIVGAIVVFVVFSVIFLIIPAKRTYDSGLKAYRHAKLAINAIKMQNVELAGTELAKTKTALDKTQKDLKALSYLRFIPVGNWYYNDADHMLKASENGLFASEILLDSLKPYADVLGLKGQGSFVMGSASDRIKTAVLTMGKITPRIDDIAKYLVLVKEHVDAVSPNHYPSFIFGKKVHDRLEQFRNLTDQGVTFVDQSRPLIKVLPSLLGEDEPKRYLILFQNDKELRSTGGFITAYAIFRIDKGIIQVERSDDIYTLDNSISGKDKAPEPIQKYLPKVHTFNLRDSNLSPDFIESMKTFRELYDRASAGVDVDGIIALDTHVLVSTIKILDDQVTASGITFTSEKDSRCDCPQVLYALEDNISRPVNYVRAGRKDLLGSLMYAMMQKALSSSPKLYWGPLFQSMLMQANQKHVLFYLFDKDAQSGIEALNAAGRIKPFDGDYLHINDTNFAGAKSNLFTTQSVEDTYTIKNDGTIEKTLTITYKNNHEPSDCNLERGGLCLNAELRDWIRVYVPKGSKLRDSKGSIVKVTTEEDLGKTYFEGFLTVRPLGKTVYTLTYQLPFKLSKGSPLPALIQKQPGTDGNEYTVKVNGRTVETFKLYADKELKLKI